jgi:hypothetical protein
MDSRSWRPCKQTLLHQLQQMQKQNREHAGLFIPAIHGLPNRLGRVRAYLKRVVTAAGGGRHQECELLYSRSPGLHHLRMRRKRHGRLHLQPHTHGVCCCSCEGAVQAPRPAPLTYSLASEQPLTHGARAPCLFPITAPHIRVPVPCCCTQ